MINLNIKVEDVLEQKEQQEVVKKPQVTFSEKNYLQARLAPNENKKSITIRLLPFSSTETSPFHKVHMHQVRVNKEVAQSGWKKFPCPIKNNHGGNACPFCEVAEEARKLKHDAVSEAEKKQYLEIEYANMPRDMWVVRCIERGHEEDGVKFWLFNSSKNKNGVYDKIINLFEQRFLSAQEKGKYHNIFDLNEGNDLTLTLTRNALGKTEVNITDDYDKTPLSNNEQQALEWINDSKLWSDIYVTKSYDYMSVIVEGGIPVYDKVKGTYVDKNKSIEEQKISQQSNTMPTVDLSTYNEQVQITENEVMHTNPILVDTDDDDLPF